LARLVLNHNTALMDLVTIKLSIDHIFESGANEVRIMDLIERVLPRWIDPVTRLPDTGETVQVIYRYDDSDPWEVGTGFVNMIWEDGHSYGKGVDWLGYDCIEIKVYKWAPFLELPPELKI